MSDLVERLIFVRDIHGMMYSDYDAITEAAARITELETALADTRRQALEEAAKVADQWARSNYSEECNTMADAIATDIRSLASDPLLDRQGKEGV